MKIILMKSILWRYKKRKRLGTVQFICNCNFHLVHCFRTLGNLKERTEDFTSGEQSHTTWIQDKYLELGSELYATNCGSMEGFGTENRRSHTIFLCKNFCIDNSLIWKWVNNTHTCMHTRTHTHMHTHMRPIKNKAEGKKSIILKIKRKSNFLKIVF